MPRQAQRTGLSGLAFSSGGEERGLARDFSRLYTDHFEFVWRTARYLGEPEASLDDATQDVFVVAYRRFQDLEARAAPRPWLFAIAMRVVSDHRRSRRRKSRLLEGVKHSPPNNIATPYDQTAHKEQSKSLLQALDALNEAQRATFVMADLEDLSVPEIADVLKVNMNTVYSRLRAARREVSRQLERARRESGDG
jgi:RNA polymerase sigma-70 factor (ECF subfamily)